MSHRDGEARARRHMRRHVRTVDTPSATTQHRATITGHSAVSHNNINNCMCSINSICNSSSTCDTTGTSACAHARAHTHARRRPTRRRSPRTAQARRARTDARCTALARPKVQRRRCHFLLRMKLGRIRAAKRSVRCFEKTKSCPHSFEMAKIAAPPAPVSRDRTAWTPRPRPTSIARIPHVGWSLGPQAHPTHCRLRRAAGYQAHPVTSARPRRRRRAGASPTPAERIYRRPYRLPRRPPSSAAVIYMYYLALRFYLLVVYYLCQSSDPSLSEPRPPPSVPPWRCAHPPAAPAPCPPRAPARST